MENCLIFQEKNNTEMLDPFPADKINVMYPIFPFSCQSVAGFFLLQGFRGCIANSVDPDQLQLIRIYTVIKKKNPIYITVLQDKG